MARDCPVAQTVKDLPAMQETRVRSLDQEDFSGEGNGSPLHYARLGESHGQRSLAGYSPRVQKELDITERLTLHSGWTRPRTEAPEESVQEGSSPVSELRLQEPKLLSLGNIGRKISVSFQQRRGEGIIVEYARIFHSSQSPQGKLV